MNKLAHRFGFWSAVLSLIFGLAYIIALFATLLGFLTPPWDVAYQVAPSLPLASAFVVLMISVHYYAASDRKIASHVAVAFATVYAVLASMVYFILLAVVIPNILAGQSDRVSLLLFDAGSFLVAVDGLAYGFMSLAALFAAVVFVGTGLVKWTRWALIAHGLLLPIIVGAVVVPALLPIGVLWVITFPLSTALLAVLFRRLSNDHGSRVIELAEEVGT
ncbi:MAG: hypothetical protein ACXV5E_07910 [Halobacteriota archaeon]